MNHIIFGESIYVMHIAWIHVLIFPIAFRSVLRVPLMYNITFIIIRDRFLVVLLMQGITFLRKAFLLLRM